MHGKFGLYAIFIPQIYPNFKSMNRILITDFALEELLKELKVGVETAISKTLKEQEEVLSKDDCAKFFGVTNATITNWAKEGWLKPSFMGGKPYFLKSELIKLLKERR